MSVFPDVTDETLSRYNVAGPRYTSYPTVPVWTRGFGPDDLAERLRRAAVEPSSPLSLYVHIPFCREMCTYCGCNVVIAKDRQRAEPYLDHLALEMDLAVGLLGERRTYAQLHLGGGTPTYLDERQLDRLWKAISARFRPTPDAEIAIEIDPVVTSRDTIAQLADYGFNRLSMGVQDFDPSVQEAINRVQSASETGALIAAARDLGFRGINVDLIYGLPRQTPLTWRRSLEQVLAMQPDRAAVYSFAYLPELRPHQKRIDPKDLPLGAAKLALFRHAYEAFVGAGFQPIGMDHFARPDDELALAQQRRTLWRNFQGYTVRAATDVVAFGVTGISDLQGAYAQTIRPLSHYYESIAAGRLAVERGCAMTPDDLRRRAVITQLMCNFWLDLADYGTEHFEAEQADLRRLESEGLLTLKGTEIELTALGRIFVRNVAMVFDAYLRKAGGDRPTFSRTV